MKRIPHISALMTAFPWHLDIDTPAQEARRFMQDHELHHLPVTRGGSEVAGVVDATQLPNGVGGKLADLVQPVRCVDAQMRADEVLDIMAQEHCAQVLVMHHQRLAGIYTWTDACRDFANQLREPFKPNGGNDAA